MANAVRLAESFPSLTVIVTFANMPTDDDVGVPLRRPEAASKAAHVGLFETEKVSVSPSASAAVGVKV
jgi:hypothetical protein